ncbi:L-proline trans-4-hydroxylase-like isoform X1 [Liolophura sinensis]|uniref:L-proline trans-4-hydroxylase-like isoform X1 n=1 Tax=Liolophura sinensis TaxID=3198878 RepID=UPI003159359D
MSEDLKQFKEKGYVVFRGLLTKEEVNRLRESMEKDQTLQENEHSRGDAMGKRIRVSLWTTVPKSITGTIVRAEKVVSKVEKLLEGEVYHYHSKLIMKDPKTGGAFLWHQDYGYWYDYNCLFPTMGTLWVAVDKADKTNGCLQILEGSHLAGRIDTKVKGDQIVADPDRVELLKQRLPLRYMELEPGDAMFFHSNILHMSSQNQSRNRRWSLVVAYNRASNIPPGKQPHGEYSPLIKAPDNEIMTCPLTCDGEDVKFYSTENVISGLEKKAET